MKTCGRPVAFMSRTLHASERHHPAVEKEATAIIEAVRKWNHFLAHFLAWLQTNDPSRLCLIAKGAVKSRTIKFKAGDLN